MDEICHDFQHDIEESVPKAIAQKILNNLFNQKASGQFCDVQFLHGSATLWAHSCVLASYSPYMMRLFTKYAEENVYWSFNKPMQVNISSVTKCNGSSRNNCVDCTCKIIDFIYTGKIKLDPEHLDHVVNLSNNLEIDVLLLICQRYKRDHYSLLDSLPESNQISTGVGCENTVDFKAYVDNLNNSVSYSFYLSSEKCELTNDLKSKSDIDLNYKNSNKRYSTDITSYNAKRSSNQVDARQYNVKSKSNEQSVKPEGYQCPSCNYRSDSNDMLKLHQKVFHRRNYICVECEYTSFKMGDVIDHAIKNSHGGNMCTVCLYEAENPVALKSHLNEHNRIFPFRCTMCKQRFKYRNDWIRHKYSPYHRNERQISVEKPKILSTRIAEETPPLNITNPASPPTTPPQPAPQSPQLEQNKPNHACRICKYEFSCLELLQKHNHIFHKRKYICLSCDFNTFKIETIIEHLLEIRHEENVCSICLYVASNTNTLMEHILDHKNAQPFSCTICKTRFQTRNEWWRHELAHGSDKPFKCHYCDQSFPTSSYLNTHIIYRHKQKKHKCKVCGYGAPFASKLEKHSLIHRNKYTCKVNNCTFNCSSEVLLKKHKKVHVLKPLSCPICSLKFKFVKNMKRHLKLIHNTENVTLKCPTCDYSNSRIDKMKEHCRNIHDNDKNILEKINKQYEGIKHYDLPETVKKRRPHSVIEKVNTNINVDINAVEDNKQSETNEQSNEKSNSNFVCGTVNDSIKQTVLLSESTGELNIMCENEGKPIPVASVTSTNMLTIGNFREGTGTVTLNETTGVLTFNNINMDSKGAVFLNESTGVLSYINLNMENTSEQSNETEQVRSEQVQLNEVTGEIITVTEDNTSSNKNINQTPEEDFPFDSFGFDFNEDSYDGFDEFDNLFFDTFSPIEQSPSTNVVEILENNTNGFFGEHTPRLDEMTGELTFNKDSMENNHENIWSSVNSFPENSIMESVTTEVYETLLNEVTGEFS